MKPKAYDHLIGNLPGFSPRQIEQHVKLYEGYVNKINEIREELAKIPYGERAKRASFSYGQFSELKRRESVAYNGARLHEMYFDGLRGSGGEPGGDLLKAIEKSFGNLSNWEADLRACAETATGGWVLLTWDRIECALRHNQIWEHSIGLMLDQEHLLALDTWEHAFMIDFGTDKKTYLTAFLRCLDWRVVADRFAAAGRRTAA